MRKALFVLVVMALLLTPVLAFAQDGQSIDFDQVVTGEITDDAPEVFYTFIGGAGDTITISMISTTDASVTGRPLDTYLYLRDASGQDIAFDDDGGAGLNSLIGPFVLPADGTYTIVAARFGGESNIGNVGTYELVVSKVDIQSIGVDQTIIIDLNDSSPAAFYYFEPAPNAVLSITGNIVQGDANTGVSVAVRTPDGQFINQNFIQPASQMILEPVFTSMGRVLLSLNREPMGGSDLTLGVVQVVLTVRLVEANAFTLGDTVTGTLDDASPSFFYAFNANQGDLLRLEGDQLSGDATFEATLFGPNGFSISGGSPAWSGNQHILVDPILIDTTGQYMLMIRRFDVNTGPGGAIGQSVGFTVTLSATQTPILEAGVAVEGNVGGDTSERVYRYSGQQGQVVRVTLGGGSGYTPSIDIQGPNMAQRGSFIMNANSQYPGTLTFEFALPAAGEYIFRVHNGAFTEQGPQTGAFRLLLEEVQ